VIIHTSRDERSPARRGPDEFRVWFEYAFGANRDVLRGTEWERWVRWPWEDDPEPGEHCLNIPPGQVTLGL